MTQANSPERLAKLCCKCKKEPRLPGMSWCRGCTNEKRNERRRKR
jgi:hypothetical protein